MATPATEAFAQPFEGSNGFTLAHGAVDVPGAYDPVRYTVSVSHTPSSPVMRMIVPGFGGMKRSSRELRDALAEQEGLTTISLEPPRNGGLVHDVLDPQRVHVDALAAILQDLPNNEQLDEARNGYSLNFGQVILLPHSMGG